MTTTSEVGRIPGGKTTNAMKMQVREEHVTNTPIIKALPRIRRAGRFSRS